MNAETLQSVSDVATLIDVTGTELPIPILKLKKALNRARDNDVFGLVASDKTAEPNIRDFCAGSGNVFVGTHDLNGQTVYYIQKRTVECRKCSNIRAVTLGMLLAGVLTYTAPLVLMSNPSGWVTLLFAGALAATPPVAINLYTVAKRALKKSNVTMRFEAAE